MSHRPSLSLYDDATRRDATTGFRSPTFPSSLRRADVRVRVRRRPDAAAADDAGGRWSGPGRGVGPTARDHASRPPP